MLEAPNWYARKYNSVVARTGESDPDAEFHIRQISAQHHESRLATIDYGDTFVLHLQEKSGIAMSGTIIDDALTAVFLRGEGTTFNGQRSEIPQLRVVDPGTEFKLEMPGRYRLMRIGLSCSALDSVVMASGLSGPFCHVGKWIEIGRLSGDSGQATLLPPPEASWEPKAGDRH